jgi:hypothetical protein
MENFYMVWVENMGTPFKRYESLTDAEAEAERLCEKEKKKTFVLKAFVKYELKNIVKTNLS